MAQLEYGEFLFGQRAAAIYELLTEPATYDTKLDIPNIQNVEFAEEENEVTLQARDVIVATHYDATRLTGSWQMAGMNLDTVALMTGAQLTTSGTTPNRVTTLLKVSTDTKPYFKLVGQSYGDEGGDAHFTAFKVRAGGIPFGRTQGEFMEVGGDLAGVFTSESPGKLWEVAAHETITAIA